MTTQVDVDGIVPTGCLPLHFERASAEIRYHAYIYTLYIRWRFGILCAASSVRQASISLVHANDDSSEIYLNGIAKRQQQGTVAPYAHCTQRGARSCRGVGVSIGDARSMSHPEGMVAMSRTPPEHSQNAAPVSTTVSALRTANASRCSAIQRLLQSARV